MSFAVRVAREDGVVIIAVEGRGAGRDLLRRITPALEESAATGDRRLLLDLREAHVSELPAADMHGFEIGVARREGMRGAGARAAVLVKSDLLFGVARMFQTIRAESPVAYGVFRDPEEAAAWLAAPSEESPPTPRR
jgi:hypothetical protein